MNQKLAIALASLAILTVSGCATSQKSNSYTTGNVQQEMKVVLATVMDVREVDIENAASGAGGVTGAAVGGLAGSNVGGGKGGVVGAVVGAVAGGVGGHLADKALNARKGLEIVYQIDGSKDVLALVQEVDDQGIKAGDRVRIMKSQFSARAVKIAAK